MTNENPDINLDCSHWLRIHGKPIGKLRFKSIAEDFQVTEHLSFQPSGKGQHVFLWIEKQNLNTAFIAEQLAKFAGVKLRDVTYAGRKDKFSRAKQWFGVNLGNQEEPNWSEFHLEGFDLLNKTRNDKKLKLGSISKNQFDITLRGLQAEQIDSIEKRLTKIKKFGVPNYFGPQRFGNIKYKTDENGNPNLPGNLSLAKKMLNGESIRNRNKASMAISALRSWLFNEFIHERIQRFGVDQLLAGDPIQLAGTKSFFILDKCDPSIESRMNERDIFITCPLWGKGSLPSTHDVRKFELSVSQKHSKICLFLEKLELSHERRAMQLFPSNLEWFFLNSELKLSFDLPTGCFATSVLREVCELEE